MSEILQSLNCAKCGGTPLTDNGDGTISCPFCGSVFAHPERVCSRCDTVNEMNARYCASCGETLREPCPRCGALNWAQAPHCRGCGAALDVLEKIAARRVETTAQRLQRIQAEMPTLKEEAERASQARLDKMWAQERVRLESLAKAKSEQRRQERLILTIAAVALAVMVIVILTLALFAQFQLR